MCFSSQEPLPIVLYSPYRAEIIAGLWFWCVSLPRNLCLIVLCSPYRAEIIADLWFWCVSLPRNLCLLFCILHIEPRSLLAFDSDVFLFPRNLCLLFCILHIEPRSLLTFDSDVFLFPRNLCFELFEHPLCLVCHQEAWIELQSKMENKIKFHYERKHIFPCNSLILHDDRQRTGLAVAMAFCSSNLLVITPYVVRNKSIQEFKCVKCGEINKWTAPGKSHVTAISTEIFKYVRIHPNFASRPVWCEKMFLCCFSLKAGRKDLKNRPKVLSSHPTFFFCRVTQDFSYLVYPNSAFFRRKGAIGGGGGGGGDWKRNSLIHWFTFTDHNRAGNRFAWSGKRKYQSIIVDWTRPRIHFDKVHASRILEIVSAHLGHPSLPFLSTPFQTINLHKVHCRLDRVMGTLDENTQAFVGCSSGEIFEIWAS